MCAVTNTCIALVSESQIARTANDPQPKVECPETLNLWFGADISNNRSERTRRACAVIHAFFLFQAIEIEFAAQFNSR
jgi:hypothetical protein